MLEPLNLTIIAAICLIIWGGLTFFWFGFWRANQRLPSQTSELKNWPSICAIVPARNEEVTIEACLQAILAQDYPGELQVVLSNDSSTDSTAEIARGIKDKRLTLIDAPPLEPGWAGKMWALEHGIAEASSKSPEFYWFTDADIIHDPTVLKSLVNYGESKKLALVSLMVRLHVRNFWEKLLVPAFIYFFCLLYPFPAINNPKSSIAGAAGGCILVRRHALENAGGIEAVRDAIIDDCAIGRAVKRSGEKIWVGLAEHSQSLRGYEGLSEFWLMVKRSAFVQLHRSVFLTICAIAGLTLTFIAPPVLVFMAINFGLPGVGLLAGAAFGLMIVNYSPTVRYHKLPVYWAMSLPLAALYFGAMTLDSAISGVFGQQIKWRDRKIGPT